METDYQVGGPIVFRGELNGKRFEDKGRIQVVAPSKQLSFTHWSPLTGTPDRPENYHLVTLDLAGSGEATRVTLTQDNLDGRAVSAKSSSDLAKNWTAILKALKKAVESLPELRTPE